jgi:hypothetical protein
MLNIDIPALSAALASVRHPRSRRRGDDQAAHAFLQGRVQRVSLIAVTTTEHSESARMHAALLYMLVAIKYDQTCLSVHRYHYH